MADTTVEKCLLWDVAAEACIRRIVDLYSKPNMTVAQMRLAFEAEGLDPIKDFSVSCRKELFDLNARG